MTTLAAITKEVRQQANPQKAAVLRRFFKTGKGEYGEGDVFVGLMVPVSRQIVRKFVDAPLTVVAGLLASKIHEERLIALLILVNQFGKSSVVGQKKIFDFYVTSLSRINNWDLVDLSAPKIVGRYLFEQVPHARALTLLKRMARSKNLWERRVAVLATFWYIKEGEFDEPCVIAEMLLKDKHDLIHKAVGWMLREMGKRSQPALEKFLQKHCRVMPRTMLRYAIERFPEPLRKKYLTGMV
jgi:3-methyladenine DNA glycosylase AlkD